MSISRARSRSAARMPPRHLLREERAMGLEPTTLSLGSQSGDHDGRQRAATNARSHAGFGRIGVPRAHGCFSRSAGVWAEVGHAEFDDQRHRDRTPERRPPCCWSSLEDASTSTGASPQPASERLTFPLTRPPLVPGRPGRVDAREEVCELRRRDGSKTKGARSCARRPTSLGSIDLWRCEPEGR